MLYSEILRIHSLEINTGGLRSGTPRVTRLASAADTASTAFAVRSLGSTRGSNAVASARAAGGKLLDLRRVKRRPADPELHHDQNRGDEAGKKKGHNDRDNGNGSLGRGRKHQKVEDRVQAVDDNDCGGSEIVVAKIVGPRWHFDYCIERVHSTDASQNKLLSFSGFLV